MKLKKKHFKRLKEIALAVNQIVPGTGSRLDKLIADIESVQKVKDTVEEPVNLADFFKRMGSFNHRTGRFEKTTVEKPLSLSELATKMACDKHRKDVEDNIATEYGWNNNPLGVDTKEVKDVDSDRPKIGDVGYFFNGDPNYYTVYGILRDFMDNGYQNNLGNYFQDFSKTPPELK